MNVPKTSSTARPLFIVALAKCIWRQRYETPLILKRPLFNLMKNALILNENFSTFLNLSFFSSLIARLAFFSNLLRGLTATFFVRYDQLNASEITTANGIRWNKGLIEIVTTQSVPGKVKLPCSNLSSTTPKFTA